MRTRLDRVRGPVRFALRKYGAGSCRPHSYCVKGVYAVPDISRDEVAPTANPSDIVNVTRPDVIVPGLTPEQSLSGAPNAEEGRFAVPQILGESE